MLFTIISVNWTKQALTDEQMLVLRNVAAHHLRNGNQNPVINFSHDLCEGHIERGEEGAYGTFGGTYFHAHLGTVDGEAWTADFLLPHNSEHFIIDDNTRIISTRVKDGKLVHNEVNVHHADVDTTAPTVH